MSERTMREHIEKRKRTGRNCREQGENRKNWKRIGRETLRTG